MFNFFRKKNFKLVIPSLGEFEIISKERETVIEGKYSSRIFGEIKLSFPTNNNRVTEHQMITLKQIENNWKDLQSKVHKDFRIDTIMIPTHKNSFYDVDAEIVLMNNNKNIISAIIKEGKIFEIIEIQ